MTLREHVDMGEAYSLPFAGCTQERRLDRYRITFGNDGVSWQGKRKHTKQAASPQSSRKPSPIRGAPKRSLPPTLREPPAFPGLRKTLEPAQSGGASQPQRPRWKKCQEAKLDRRNVEEASHRWPERRPMSSESGDRPSALMYYICTGGSLN